MSLEYLGRNSEWHTPKPEYERYGSRSGVELPDLGHGIGVKVKSELYTPCSGADWRNPFDMYSRLRKEAPLYRVPDNGEGEDYYVLSRYKDVFAASMDGELYTSTEGLTPSYKDRELHEGRETPIVMMDGPEHVELRHVALRTFSPDKMKSYEPILRQFVIEQILVGRQCSIGTYLPGQAAFHGTELRCACHEADNGFHP